MTSLINCPAAAALGNGLRIGLESVSPLSSNAHENQAGPERFARQTNSRKCLPIKEERVRRN